MALETRLSTFAVDAQANALASLLDNGYSDILTAPKPDTCDEPVTTQTVLVTMEFSNPAFAPSNSGVISANPLSPGMGLTTGNAVWFRAYMADHVTAIFDGTVGTKNANMVLPIATMFEGVTVRFSSLTHTVKSSEGY